MRRKGIFVSICRTCAVCGSSQRYSICLYDHTEALFDVDFRNNTLVDKNSKCNSNTSEKATMRDMVSAAAKHVPQGLMDGVRIQSILVFWMVQSI